LLEGENNKKTDLIIY